ncbi:unnamed protein product [Lampetra planeri]
MGRKNTIVGCTLRLSVSFSTAALYGSLALFQAILQNVFLLYYVEMFVSVYKIDKLSFWVGETIFLVWNSINDPLFGWISDRKLLTSQDSSGGLSSPSVVLGRLHLLSQTGPLLALSFLTFWVAWAPAGLQFVLCLCLYDGFLTAVGLQHSALLADLAVSANDRARLNTHSSAFAALGSASVFASYVAWSRENMVPFRWYCVVLALVSALGFAVCSRLLRNSYVASGKRKHEDAELMDKLYMEKQEGKADEPRLSLRDYVRQLSQHRNLRWFVLMNLVQVFHCHFNSNFFPLFLEHLLADRISLSTGSLLLGISYIAPHLNNLYFLSLCKKHGVYKVVMGLFYLKLVLSLVMLMAGPDHSTLLCFFIASNRVFTEGTCRLLSMVISDLVDEDFVLNERRQAASALLFGMVALVTKPGQTFAPLIGTWMLASFTGFDIFQSSSLLAVVTSSAPGQPLPPLQSPTVSGEALRQGCFVLLVCVPVVCGIVQILFWYQFRLHGKVLHRVKERRVNSSWMGGVKSV